MRKDFLRPNKRFDLDSWAEIDEYTKLAYPWLPSMGRGHGKIFCFLNMVWPTKTMLDELPKNFDIYVFSSNFEYVDYRLIDDYVTANPNKQIIYVGPYESGGWKRLVDDLNHADLAKKISVS